MSLVFKGIYLGGGGGGANLTTLDVTPMTNYQSISPEEGYDGFSLVNVSAVNSSIDQNITASNIASGVNILGVTGSMVVPNGTIEITSNASWNVAQYEFANINVAGGRPAKYGMTVDKLLPNESIAWPISTEWGTPADMYLSNVHTLLNRAFAEKFINCKGINSFTTDAQNIGAYAFVNAFYGSSIQEANFYNVTETTNRSCFGSAFVNCDNFRKLVFSNLENVYANGGSYIGAFSNICYNCQNLSIVDFPKLKNIVGSYSVSALLIQGIFVNSFAGCVNLTTVNLPLLNYVKADYICYCMFSGCTNLSYVEFPSLEIINGRSAFGYMFANSGIKNIMFPALRECDSLAFTEMLNGVTDCTTHFPQAMESVMNSWASVTNGFGGTNTTVLFDL